MLTHSDSSSRTQIESICILSKTGREKKQTEVLCHSQHERRAQNTLTGAVRAQKPDLKKNILLLMIVMPKMTVAIETTGARHPPRRLSHSFPGAAVIIQCTNTSRANQHGWASIKLLGSSSSSLGGLYPFLMSPLEPPGVGRSCWPDGCGGTRRGGEERVRARWQCLRSLFDRRLADGSLEG